MAEVLLVHAQDAHTKGFVGSMPPLGVCWLATALESVGVSVAIADMHVETRPFEEILLGERPSILGISSTTAARFDAFGYATECKRLLPGTLVLLGGSHVSCAAQDTLEHLPQLDAVVRGEGEQALCGITRRFLLGNRDLSGIAGVTFRRNGEVIHNPDAVRVQDLDSLGFPARHLLRMEAYDLENEFIGGKAQHVTATRGCPFQCTFCSAAAIWGRRYTYRSPAHVIDEIELLRDQYGAEGIRFMDALITVRKDYVLQLCDEIEKRNVGLPWECEVRVDTVDEEILRRMRKAGCYYLDFGVESINPRVLGRMKKQTTPEQIRSVLKLTHHLGFKTKAFFTLGHISETVAEARETLRFIRKFRAHISRIGGGVGISVYPGTEVEEYARQSGFLPAGFSWSQPYFEKENLYFSASPHVPLLIQPQMTMGDLHGLRRRHLFIKLQDPQILAANLKRLADRATLRRFVQMAKGVFSHKKRAE